MEQGDDPVGGLVEAELFDAFAKYDVENASFSFNRAAALVSTHIVACPSLNQC
jgi:hypothetical protein